MRSLGKLCVCVCVVLMVLVHTTIRKITTAQTFSGYPNKMINVFSRALTQIRTLTVIGFVSGTLTILDNTLHTNYNNFV